MTAIRVAGLLYGRDYEVLWDKNIVVEDGVIVSVEEPGGDALDLSGFFAIPAPANSHVHLGDLVAPEACSRYDLDGYVGARGVKHAYIRLLVDRLGKTLDNPILKMHSLILDYAEIPEICIAAKTVYTEGPRYTGLGRAPGWDEERVREIIEVCGGLGISDYSSLLPHNSTAFPRDALVSAHVSETPRQGRLGDIYYIHSIVPRLRIAVHGTYLDDAGLRYLADNNIYLALCPRSNLWFTGKLPPIAKAYDAGVKMLIGSDNAGCFEPHVWRDAELVYSALHSRIPDIDPRIVLDMLYANPASAAETNIGTIEKGAEAHILLIDKEIVENTMDIHASIIKRLEPWRVAGYMHGEKIRLVHKYFSSSR